jgi:hypothetical protein
MRERGEDTLDMVRVSSVGGGPAYHRFYVYVYTKYSAGGIFRRALHKSICSTSELINGLQPSATTQRSS